MSFVKTADASELGNPVEVGDVITYTYTVKNTGGATISNITITDDLPGLSSITLDKNVLLPNETAIGTATYAIRPTDLVSRYVENIASVTGVQRQARVSKSVTAAVISMLPR